jgi:phage terminase large subunit-like protein
MSELKSEILALLAEKERRVKTRVLDSLYPDVGNLRRELYPKHLAFFAAGKTHRERCMMAANRVGKSYGAGGYEMTLHLTGLYPKWWKGRRFNHPINAWAAGDSSKTTRDVIQRILLGEHLKHGTGLIPGDCIVNTTPKPGISNGIEDIYVKHYTNGIYDGESRIGLKSYEQGAASFMGTEIHVGWLDEEPPLEVYTEMLTRTMIVPGATLQEKITGMIIATFTPLNGLSEVVLNFMPQGVLPENNDESEKFIIQVTWDEVPHLTKEMKESLWLALPSFERDARSKGTPQLGSGKIYTVPEEQIVVEPFEIPNYWPRFYAMDIGFTSPTAVLWFAWDRERDILYVYREYYECNKQPWEHAYHIKTPHAWIPGVVDPSSRIGNRGMDPNSQKAIIDVYRDLGLKLETANNAIIAGITEVQNRLQTNRLKIFSYCQNTREEYRIYRYKESMPAPKQRDHAMDALRYGCMSGLDIAITEPLYDDNYYDERSEERGKSRVGGY